MAYLSPNTNKPTSSAEMPVFDKPVFWCQTCSLKFDVPPAAYQHLVSPKHKNKIINASNGMNGHTETGIEQCELCNVALNSAVSAQMHYNSRKHLNRVKLKGTSEPVMQNGLVKEKSAADSSSFPLHCPDCGVTSNSEAAAEMHRKGKKHINRMAIMQKYPMSSNAAVDHASSRDDRATKVVPTNIEVPTLNAKGKKVSKDAKGKKCPDCKVRLNSDLQEAQHYSGMKHKIRAGLMEAPPGWEERQQPGYWAEQEEKKRHQYLGLGATIDENSKWKKYDPKRKKEDKNATLAEKSGGADKLFTKTSFQKFFVSASKVESFAPDAKPGVSIIDKRHREERERQMELENEARDLAARMAQNPYQPQRQVGPATYYDRQGQANGDWNAVQSSGNNYTWNDPNSVRQNQMNPPWHAEQANVSYDNSWYDQNTNPRYDHSAYGQQYGQGPGGQGQYDATYRPPAGYDPYNPLNNNNNTNNNNSYHVY